MTSANLASIWPWVADGLIALAVIAALFLTVDAYRLFARPSFKGMLERRRQQRLAQFRDTLESALAALWAPEMERRLSALVFAQRWAVGRSDVTGLGHILIAFIRHRLGQSRTDDGFEDIKLALAVLATKSVRAAQAETKQGIDLSGVNFRRISLFGVDLVGFRLAGCVFDRCQMGSAKLMRADLSGASLAGADLTGANLTSADLSGADLSAADFTAATVKKAVFNSANISGAVLVGTIGLEQEQIDEALGDSDTAVPEEFRFVPVRAQRQKPVGDTPIRAAE